MRFTASRARIPFVRLWLPPVRKLEHAYFHGKILTKGQYEAMIRLLEIFANHLSIVANQILVGQETETPSLIARAKKLITENQSRELSLKQIAETLSVSTFYFCRMFKKATGMTFTEYLGRVRVERAKNLLLNPHARVSEIAYDCGFASLTHFNRVFKRIAGLSPTAYRHGLHAA
jgi:AraC-like DNA-binding protein